MRRKWDKNRSTLLHVDRNSFYFIYSHFLHLMNSNRRSERENGKQKQFAVSSLEKQPLDLHRLPHRHLLWGTSAPAPRAFPARLPPPLPTQPAQGSASHPHLPRWEPGALPFRVPLSRSRPEKTPAAAAAPPSPFPAPRPPASPASPRPSMRGLSGAAGPGPEAQSGRPAR